MPFSHLVFFQCNPDCNCGLFNIVRADMGEGEIERLAVQASEKGTKGGLVGGDAAQLN